MKSLFVLRLAILNLLQKRLRTWLTVGGIAISIGVMVFLLGLGQGLRSLVTSEIAQSGSQQAVSVSSKRTKQLKLDASTIAKLTSISGVSSVEQQVGLSGRITYHGISLDVPVYGVSPGYMETTVYQLRNGRDFSAASASSRELIVSTRALQALGLKDFHDAVGKKVELAVTIDDDWATNQKVPITEFSQPDFTIVGIVEKGGSPLLYVPLEILAKQGVNVASEVNLTVSVPDKIASVRESIEQLGFQTASIRDTIDQVNRIFSVIQTILIIFGGITLVIAVFGTLNTITIALVEQTRQVGFLRIIGINKRDVGRLFMLQSIALSTSGAVLGSILGLTLGVLCNLAVTYVAGQSGSPGWQLYQVPLVAMILMIASSVALGWLLGIGPARRATSLRPMEALNV
jgi:ABC-type antimicrobial peptide transport system permease subunit